MREFTFIDHLKDEGMDQIVRHRRAAQIAKYLAWRAPAELKNRPRKCRVILEQFGCEPTPQNIQKLQEELERIDCRLFKELIESGFDPEKEQLIKEEGGIYTGEVIKDKKPLDMGDQISYICTTLCNKECEVKQSNTNGE